MVSDAVVQKARRMIAEGRVQAIEGAGAGMALVAGDSAIYLVAFAEGVGHCTCPAQSEAPCSHMLAATLGEELMACSLEQLWERWAA